MLRVMLLSVFAGTKNCNGNGSRKAIADLVGGTGTNMPFRLRRVVRFTCFHVLLGVDTEFSDGLSFMFFCVRLFARACDHWYLLQARIFLLQIATRRLRIVRREVTSVNG